MKKASLRNPMGLLSQAERLGGILKQHNPEFYDGELELKVHH